MNKMETKEDKIIRPTLANLLIWENKPIPDNCGGTKTEKQEVKHNCKRRHWSKEEEASLTQGVKEGLRWQEISIRYLPDRLWPGCASHWKSMVRKQEKGTNDKYKWVKGNSRRKRCRWTKIDESLLKLGVEEGLRWRKIATKYLPNRDGSGCSKHWRLMQNKIQE